MLAPDRAAGGAVSCTVTSGAAGPVLVGVAAHLSPDVPGTGGVTGTGTDVEAGAVGAGDAGEGVLATAPEVPTDDSGDPEDGVGVPDEHPAGSNATPRTRSTCKVLRRGRGVPPPGSR